MFRLILSTILAPLRALMPATPTGIEDDELETCGKLAVAELTRLWKLDIYDPRHTDDSANADRCRALILDIIRDGGGWTWIDEYTGDGSLGNEQWCGFTAGKGWAKWIPAEVRRDWWASCFRLDHWASYRDMVIGKKTYKNVKKPAVGGRLYAKFDAKSTTLPFEPRAGDILIVGHGELKHICVVRGYDAKRRVFLTIEGNGSGAGPDGKKQHGMVIAERPLGSRSKNDYYAMRLIRPAASDLA